MSHNRHGRVEKIKWWMKLFAGIRAIKETIENARLLFHFLILLLCGISGRLFYQLGNQVADLRHEVVAVMHRPAPIESKPSKPVIIYQGIQPDKLDVKIKALILKYGPEMVSKGINKYKHDYKIE